MRDATNSTNKNPSSKNDEAQAAVGGYGIGVPGFGPTMSPAGFELETLGSPTGTFAPSVAPGHPVGAPAIPLAMRKAGKEQENFIIIAV